MHRHDYHATICFTIQQIFLSLLKLHLFLATY